MRNADSGHFKFTLFGMYKDVSKPFMLLLVVVVIIIIIADLSSLSSWLHGPHLFHFLVKRPYHHTCTFRIILHFTLNFQAVFSNAEAMFCDSFHSQVCIRHAHLYLYVPVRYFHFV
jgi:hypothetical protein